ncbi:Myotubularin-related protein 13 [Eumeta japonica]|uniref:Myotubularin-related protein 13 n=1 Tax=Eumeta variegata TaxID=151549 RepID=A0A4C1SX03_EUMVA|nr:Myotubularin-related protein 13 [Eumeta japonica]
MCRSYPAIFVAPLQVNDAALTHLGRCYKSQRIPAPTWRHRNGALLIRGALPHSKSVIGATHETKQKSGTIKNSSAVSNSNASAYRKIRLYVLGEKSQTKSSINADLGPNSYR